MKKNFLAAAAGTIGTAALGVAIVLGSAPGASAAPTPVAVIAPVATTSAAPSPAATDTAKPRKTGDGPAVNKACRALNKLDKHAEKFVARAHADAKTKGSVAWLRAQSTAAKASGDTAKATALAARADKREASVAKLVSLEAAVAKVHTDHC